MKRLSFLAGFAFVLVACHEGTTSPQTALSAKQSAVLVALTNYISNDSTDWYSANPAGGQTPYTYLWEWCAIDCGDNAPVARAPVQPNTVAHGWQVHDDTTRLIYWVYVHPVTLRSTVTDAVGTKAVATYYIP